MMTESWKKLKLVGGLLQNPSHVSLSANQNNSTPLDGSPPYLNQTKPQAQTNQEMASQVLPMGTCVECLLDKPPEHPQRVQR